MYFEWTRMSVGKLVSPSRWSLTAAYLPWSGGITNACTEWLCPTGREDCDGTTPRQTYLVPAAHGAGGGIAPARDSLGFPDPLSDSVNELIAAEFPRIPFLSTPPLPVKQPDAASRRKSIRWSSPARLSHSLKLLIKNGMEHLGWSPGHAFERV